MLKKRPKRNVPLLKHPGDPEPQFGSPGSIEQQLDMVEEGDLRGDEVTRRTDLLVTPEDPNSEDPLDLVSELQSFNMTRAERDREGDEMSGDDHSSGLQGEDFELQHQGATLTGTPGESLELDGLYDKIISLEIERKKRRKVVK